MSTAYGGMSYPPRKVNFGWISEPWQLFSANAGIWLLAVCVTMLVPFLVSFLVGLAVGFSGGMPSPSSSSSPFSPSSLSGGLPPLVNISLRIFTLVWNSFFYGGIYLIAVKQVKGELISVGDIFSGGPLFGKMLLFNIIYGLLTTISVILCILPFFAVTGLFLASPCLLVEGASVMDALSRSAEAIKSDWLTAAGFMFVMFLLILVSAVPCGLGLLVTLPMYWLISALAYRDMIGLPNPPRGDTYGYGGPGPLPGVWPPPPGSPSPPPYGGPPSGF